MDPSVSANPVKNVFVFGSDLSGRHDSGDALTALRRYGAVYGRGVGLQGRSYAIPVRDEEGKLMPVAVIARYVSAFLRFAAIHREITFHVYRIGCERGGYHDDELAPLFAGAPPNCRLPRGWERYLQRRVAADPEVRPEDDQHMSGATHTIMDLLVSYPRGYYGRAREETLHILRQLGDPEPSIGKSGTPGVAVVHTCLDNRWVIARCWKLHESEPGSFRFAIKWVPVDYWCERDLDAIRRLIEKKVASGIDPQETWAMEVEKRGWDQYHTAEIIERLAGAINRKVRLKAPDKLVRVDILATAAAICIVRPGEFFSVHAPSQ